MAIIDFHNHYYPMAYLDALQSGQSVVKVDVDAEGNPRLHYPGDYNMAVRGHRDIDFRKSVLAKYGVDMQVITMTTPGTHVESSANAAQARVAGERCVCRVVARDKGKFWRWQRCRSTIRPLR